VPVLASPYARSMLQASMVNGMSSAAGPRTAHRLKPRELRAGAAGMYTDEPHHPGAYGA
jgi:hypothetical protein